MRRVFTVSAVSGIFLGLLIGMGSTSWAQGRTRGRFYNKTDVSRIIKRLEDNTDRFKSYIDSEIDKTRLDKTPAEDRIWDRVRALESATDRLRSRFDRTDTWRETRNEVQDVVQEGKRIEQLFERYQIYRRVFARWAGVRRDINTLAGVYEIPPIR
ncbi:MAG: hypothetical protein IPO77_12110 [Acidobacteria bacterium]|nr:hypothetical protein [Acidobacteriota bacterium]